jgi:hypothetical protein
MADKQTALVNAIADGVSAKMTPEFANIADSVAKIQVTVSSCLARLTTLEASVNNGTANAKRAPRTGGGKAPAGKKPAAPKGKAGAPDASRVTNALLYFRFALQTDLEGYRETYGSQENLEEAEKDQTVAKRDKDKDEAGYWSAVGAAFWKTLLSEDQKLEVKEQYKAWKEQSARDESGDGLEEDEEPSSDP